ncbi:MAG: hypothetical protein L0219_11030, partial [Phycisphaerales bacterium]|nr:hypothetical protein [Phycisphaerales bacterium]
NGCEDANANQRDQVQQAIQDIQREFQLAVAGAETTEPETAAAQEQKLNGIISRLAQVNGGEPGQQASKSILSATALRELANMKLATAQQLETAHRQQRQVLHGKVDAALNLQAAADAVDSVNPTAQREALSRALDSAKARAEELSRRIPQLQGPIEQNTGENQASAQEVEKLEIEVGQLRQQARELGRLAGLETFQRSVQVGRQADKIKYAIAQREIELTYSLKPEHAMAEAQVRQLNSLVDVIEAAQASLDALEKAFSADQAKTRAQITSLETEVIQTVKQIGAESSDQLKSSYDEAVGALEKASNQVQAARGNDAGRPLAVAIHEAQCRLHWSAAQGLGDHRSLLERLAVAGPLFEAGRFGDELKAVSAAYDQEIEQAKAANASAQEALGQVQTRGDQTGLDAYRQQLERAAAALEGNFSQPDEEPTDSGHATASAHPGAPSRGFATAQDLFAHLNASLGKGVGGFQEFYAWFRAETPEGRRSLQASQKMLTAFVRIDKALQAKFNAGFVDAPGFNDGMAATLPSLANATVTEQTDEKVVYSFATMGPEGRFVLRKIDGSWWVDADEMTEQQRQMLPMMEQIMSKLDKECAALETRIRAGEFKTLPEAVAAFGQTMMSSMGMGGMTPPAQQ